MMEGLRVELIDGDFKGSHGIICMAEKEEGICGMIKLDIGIWIVTMDYCVAPENETQEVAMLPGSTREFMLSPDTDRNAKRLPEAAARHSGGGRMNRKNQQQNGGIIRNDERGERVCVSTSSGGSGLTRASGFAEV